MSSSEVRSAATNGSRAATVALKLEVVTLPVADVDRAKAFYAGLGWREDADISRGDAFRVVQFTPPQSACSIHFGVGLTAAAPGSADRLILQVADIDAARAELIGFGVAVSEVDDQRSSDEEQRSYSLYASFEDPDGNGWLLQEITTRFPGREWGAVMEVAALADLLHETSERHGRFEALAPPHDWWDWYAAYMLDRESGRDPDHAAAAADRYMAESKHIVVLGSA